jgi:4'-phosphopantetheinyl transferase EntD
MFTSLLPQNLYQLLRRTFSGHQLHAVLLPLIAPEKYAAWLDSAPSAVTMLSPSEEKRLHSFRLAKRRSEWLTGRICAKLAIHQFLQKGGIAPAHTAAHLLEIVNEESGRPCLSGLTAAISRNLDISISHSRAYGMALIADVACGIDIQRSETTLMRVTEKFCSRDEALLLHETLRNWSDSARLTLLWAAKEAAKKALSRQFLPGFLEMNLTAILPSNETCWILTLRHSPRHSSQPSADLRAVTSFFADYAIAGCLLEEFPHA